MAAQPLVEVENLSVNFYTQDGVVSAVDGLTYQIGRGEKFGVVGESGAGKSVTALSLMRLIENPGRIERGSVRFCDDEAVSEFADAYPNRVVDVPELRSEYDRSELERRLTDSGIDPETVDDDGALNVASVVESGHAAEVGLIGEEDFVVRDGDRQYIDVMRAPEDAVRKLRGNRVAMIFQDAQTALNPVYSVGEQIAEAIRHHLGAGDEEARERTIQLLDQVGIPEAETRYSDYPHEFSGGMQQRAVIAMALSCDPDLLLCDEPTTALDVTIEAQILELIEELADEFDTAVQLITHDLGVIAEVCDRVMVMYAGKPVEKAPVEELYYDPKMPYTVGLMSSIPRVGDPSDRLQTIPGTMPDLVDLPPGCSFHPRCPFAEEACTMEEPPLLDPETGEEASGEPTEHSAACLEWAGKLEEGLDYDVEVRDSTAGPEMDVEAPGAGSAGAPRPEGDHNE